MRRLATMIACQVTGQSEIQQDMQMVAYGLELLIDGLIQILVILGVAWLLGLFLPVAIVLGVAGLYRRYSGGVHCTAFYRCLMVSTGVFLGLGYITRVLGQHGFIYTFYWVALGASLLMAFRWAPADNPVKPIPTVAKRIELRHKSLLTALIATAMVIWTSYGRLLDPLVITGITLGILWQSFTITPWGYRFIGLLDRCLTIR